MNRKPFKNFYFFDWLWLKSGSQRKRNNIGQTFPSSVKHRTFEMQAASMDHFCRCCRKLIGKKAKFYLKLFGKKTIAKGNLKPFENTEILTCKKKDSGVLLT